MQISSSEWEVLRVVWALDRPTSTVIGQVLSDKLNWSPSTIKTLLGRLVDKGILSTERQGRQFIYRALVSETDGNQSQVTAAFNKICQRQHWGLIKSVLADLDMTAEQVADLEALLWHKKEQIVEEIVCNCLPGQCRCGKEGCHG